MNSEESKEAIKTIKSNQNRIFVTVDCEFIMRSGATGCPSSCPHLWRINFNAQTHVSDKVVCNFTIIVPAEEKHLRMQTPANKWTFKSETFHICFYDGIEALTPSLHTTIVHSAESV